MKSEFVNYLQPDSVLLLEGKTKKEILEEIITFATTRCTLDDIQLREAIWKREKMMTTGIGNGLALPHIRVAGFPAPLVIVGRCSEPITDYHTLDNQPVRLVVFLAADEKDQDAYLKILGSISTRLKDKALMAEILAAPGKEEIFAILSR
ncbi:MAG: PTS sugar transporter subunit IIA [Lentisphaeria bacterium]|nr:PTS sugar transporter subunit IIA [Lentisphaeria bacterium]